MKKLLSILLFTFTLSACTWVELTPEGEKVRVLSLSEVQSCKKKGKTTVSLKDKIAGIERNKKKVQKELEMLGRNSAVSINGDTIVATSDVMDGKQAFDIYRCINP